MRGALQAGTEGREDRVGRRGDRYRTLSRLCWPEYHGFVRELVTFPLEDGVESVLLALNVRMEIFLEEQLPSLDSGIFEFKGIFERDFEFSNLNRRLLIRVKHIF